MLSYLREECWDLRDARRAVWRNPRRNAQTTAGLDRIFGTHRVFSVSPLYASSAWQSLSAFSRIAI
jgi:hypothetical protein